VSCAWMLFTPHQTASLSAQAPNAGPPDAGSQGVWYAPGSGLDDMGDLQSPMTGMQHGEDARDAEHAEDAREEDVHDEGLKTAPLGARDDEGPAA